MKAIQFVRAVVLFVASWAAMADSAPLYVKDISKMERSAWLLACEFKAYDCSKLAAPQVWYVPMIDTHGRYYQDALGIQINVKLLGQPFSGLVMVHEMVHYIQQAQINASHLHGYRSHCDREAEAFNITLAVAYTLGIKDARLTSWPEMSAAYSCEFPRLVFIRRY